MRFLAALGAVGLATAMLALGFFFGGFYSVAATSAEPELVRWALVQVRTASIARHADTEQPASLHDEATMRRGARSFAKLGCANCHGAPGVTWAKFSEGLRPDPPGLADIVNERSSNELFWVVKNGINMTGMPSFERAGASDNEIWGIVAFLKALPTVSADEFKEWSTTEPLSTSEPRLPR